MLPGFNLFSKKHFDKNKDLKKGVIKDLLNNLLTEMRHLPSFVHIYHWNRIYSVNSPGELIFQYPWDGKLRNFQTANM